MTRTRTRTRPPSKSIKGIKGTPSKLAIEVRDVLTKRGGVTQTILSEQTRVNQSTLSLWLNGKYEPQNPELLDKLYDVMRDWIDHGEEPGWKSSYVPLPSSSNKRPRGKNKVRSESKRLQRSHRRRTSSESSASSVGSSDSEASTTASADSRTPTKRPSAVHGGSPIASARPRGGSVEIPASAGAGAGAASAAARLKRKAKVSFDSDDEEGDDELDGDSEGEGNASNELRAKRARGGDNPAPVHRRAPGGSSPLWGARPKPEARPREALFEVTPAGGSPSASSTAAPVAPTLPATPKGGGDRFAWPSAQQVAASAARKPRHGRPALDYGFFGLSHDGVDPLVEYGASDAEFDLCAVVRAGVSLADPFPTARLLMPVTTKECNWTWDNQQFMVLAGEA